MKTINDWYKRVLGGSRSCVQESETAIFVISISVFTFCIPTSFF